MKPFLLSRCAYGFLYILYLISTYSICIHTYIHTYSNRQILIIESLAQASLGYLTYLHMISTNIGCYYIFNNTAYNNSTYIHTFVPNTIKCYVIHQTKRSDEGGEGIFAKLRILVGLDGGIQGAEKLSFPYMRQFLKSIYRAQNLSIPGRYSRSLCVCVFYLNLRLTYHKVYVCVYVYMYSSSMNLLHKFVLTFIFHFRTGWEYDRCGISTRRCHSASCGSAPTHATYI